MDAAGRVLARKRLPEGVAGIARLHALIGQQPGRGRRADAEVVIGIETDRGPWVAALVAAGYVVFAVNPLQASRYRERHGVSGAKSDRGDAHMLADMVRTDSHQLRAVAGDSRTRRGVKVVARTHKTLIWERTRQVQRLRYQLREYSRPRWRPSRTWTPPTRWSCWQGTGPGPGREADPRAGLRRAQARPPPRRSPPGRPRSWPRCAAPQLGQPDVLVTAAYAATAPVPDRGDHRPERAGQDPARAGGADFGRHPDAEIYLSQPGLGDILGARVLGEFGDDPRPLRQRQGPQELRRHLPAHPRLGQEEVVAARFIRNDRLTDALMAQAFTALNASPGARALYDDDAPAAPSTTPPCARSPTGSSASCTDA